jgi:hypothetical protein
MLILFCNFLRSPHYTGILVRAKVESRMQLLLNRMLCPLHKNSVALVQESLLQAQWPPSILEHENACVITEGHVLHACMDCPRYTHLQHEISLAMSENKARLVRINHLTNHRMCAFDCIKDRPRPKASMSPVSALWLQDGQSFIGFASRSSVTCSSQASSNHRGRLMSRVSQCVGRNACLMSKASHP